MAHIRPGDERFHHSDCSHRWSGGPADDAGQQSYQHALREHMDGHRNGEDMPGRQPSPPVPAPTAPARTDDRG